MGGGSDHQVMSLFVVYLTVQKWLYYFGPEQYIVKHNQIMRRVSVLECCKDNTLYERTVNATGTTTVTDTVHYNRVNSGITLFTAYHVTPIMQYQAHTQYKVTIYNKVRKLQN